MNQAPKDSRFDTLNSTVGQMKEKEVDEENEENEEEAVCRRIAVHSHVVKIEAIRVNFMNEFQRR